MNFVMNLSSLVIENYMGQGPYLGINQQYV